MAAPSISGVTLLRTTTSSTGVTSSDASITVTTSSTNIDVGSLNTTTGVELWVEFTCDSTFNLTGRGMFFGFRHNISLTTASFALLSASGERRWPVTCSTNNVVEFYLDCEGSGFADTGSFDLTAVAKIRFYVTGSGSSGRNVFLYRPYAFDKTVGVIFGDGDISNPLIPGSTHGLIQSLLNGSVDAAEIIASNYVGMPVPITLAPTVSDFRNGCIAFQPNDYTNGTSLSRPRISLTNRVIRINSTAAQPFSGVHFVGISGEEFAFADVSGFSNNYASDMLILRHSTADLGLAVFNGVLAEGTGAITGGTSFGGAVRDNTASYAIEWDGATTFDGLDLTGTDNDHFINCDGTNFVDGATLDISNITFGTPGVRKIRVNASGKTLNIETAGGFTLSDVTVVAGTVNVIEPTNEILITGIPDVINAILAVVNLTTSAVSFPTLSGGGATVPLDAATNYLFVADAPGYLSQRVTLGGTTPAFEFTLPDYRALYEAGVNRSADIGFNYSTFVVLISDGTPVLPFADVFRTIEDYLSTTQGVLFPNPPFPVVIASGGAARNYLFFPYDQDNDAVNPVVIRPNPANLTDPTLTDFVIVLEGAPAPLFDIFDFSQAGGRTIRFQTDSVAAIVSVSGGLSTEDRGILNTIASQVEPLAQTLDSPGVFSSEALINAPSGGGTGLGPEDIARLERIENQLIADEIKGAARYQRLLPGTQTVILDKDVTFDRREGFTLIEHQEPAP